MLCLLTEFSATLSEANNQAIFNAIAEIRANMPFLVDLSVEERKRLAKNGRSQPGLCQPCLYGGDPESRFLAPVFLILMK